MSVTVERGLAASRAAFLPIFQRFLDCFMFVVARGDGESRFSLPEGDKQSDQIQRSPEVTLVLSDVSETMQR